MKRTWGSPRLAAGGLTIAGALLLLALLALALLWLGQERRAHQHRAEQRLVATGDGIARELGDSLTSLDLIFDGLDANPLISARLAGHPLTDDQRRTVSTQMNNALTRAPRLGQILIVDASCRIVLSTLNDAGASLRGAPLCDWMHGKGRHSRRSETDAGGPSGEPGGLTHALRLTDALHNTTGMVIGTVSPTAVSPLLAAAASGLGDGAEILVIDRHGHLAAAWPGPGADRLATVRPDQTRTLIPGSEAPDLFSGRSPLDRQERIYSERSLDTYPVRVIVGRAGPFDSPAFGWWAGGVLLAWFTLVLLVWLLLRRRQAVAAYRQLLLQSVEQQRCADNTLRTILETMPCAVLLIDHQGWRICFANAVAQQLLQLERDGMGLIDIDGGHDKPRLRLPPIDEWLKLGRRVDGETVTVTRGGLPPLTLSASLRQLPMEPESRSLLILQDLAPQQALQQQLASLQQRIEALSQLDPVTRLSNRRAAEARLAVEVGRCRRYGRPLALARFVLEPLAEFHRQHGNEAGDNLLRAVADTLTRHTRLTDLCARLADGDFLVLFSDTQLKYAHKVMDRIVGQLTESVYPLSGPQLGLRIGLAAWQPDDTPEQLIERAERLMQHADRNRVACAPPD